LKTDGLIPSASRVAPASTTFSATYFLKNWMPVVLWLALIWSFSSEMGSSRRTSRFIGPILRWLHPEISETAISHVQLVVRKGAHVMEYAVLALLLRRALRRPTKEVQHRWNWRIAAAAFAIALGCAMGDEWRQSFVRDRQGQISDVAIDGAGACLGLLGAWAIGRQRGKW
jgi:VanZ family protein